jgi:hypothetical protein
MRNLVLSIAAVATLLCACGASSKEVAMARTARYKGDKLQLFAETKAVVATSYTVTKSDETSLGMQTAAKWFSPEGLTQNPRGEGTEMVDLVDKSINIAMVVELLPDGDAWIVKITPIIARYNRGIPKPEPLKEGDISLPGWVQAKIDTLALDINKGLKKYEVQSVPGPVPAGSSPPPAEPPVESVPADDSAAPTP